MNTSQPLEDNVLKIPSQSWGIFLISILALFLETLFIRWIGTEIRIFAYLQNTILVVCFLGLGLGAFTSSKPIQIKQSLIPMTVFLLLMTIPIWAYSVNIFGNIPGTWSFVLLSFFYQPADAVQRNCFCALFCKRAGQEQRPGCKLDWCSGGSVASIDYIRDRNQGSTIGSSRLLPTVLIYAACQVWNTGTCAPGACQLR